MSLISEIEIGKEYIWNSFPIEILCPGCNINLGNDQGNLSFRVKVLATSSNYTKSTGRIPYCASCGCDHLHLMDGWYAVIDAENPLHNEIGNVPYTQLEEIV